MTSLEDRTAIMVLTSTMLICGDRRVGAKVSVVDPWRP
jgi:hypothetical protein